MYPLTNQNPNISLGYEKRTLIHDALRIDIYEVLRAVLLEMKKKGWGSPLHDWKIRNEKEATYIKELINAPSSFFQSFLNIQTQHEDWQTIDYIASNLKRGFIFYFICNGCERNARYLYRPPHNQWLYDMIPPFLCWRCNRLTYKSWSKRKRTLSRILHKPDFHTDFEKEQIIKLVNITEDDVKRTRNADSRTVSTN